MKKEKIQIKNWSGSLLFEYSCKDNTIKKTLEEAVMGGADLRGANLRGADLRGAYLGGADLRGAKNYYNSHDIAIEIIRSQKEKTFTEKEWAIIGKIIVERTCWKKIKKDYGKKVLPIFKKIAKAGWKEYLEYYKELLK